jgi:hypothetical protein
MPAQMMTSRARYSLRIRGREKVASLRARLDAYAHKYARSLGMTLAGIKMVIYRDS